jgi:hypothetical protein
MWSIKDIVALAKNSNHVRMTTSFSYRRSLQLLAYERVLGFKILDDIGERLIDDDAAKILEYARMCRCAYLRILGTARNTLRSE